ncbi:hypothetical protein CDD80_2050 [Ophiocordyceps camponoti-rufipedis]|uniref:Uncharacterized protein n=1 Tax=Ophiocordyceps camponoti-rufipedis TaxID=2004952 RepID=A0A2C5Z9G7_9HYPO|nr:hypothetical protein CDD80_2050 [Ophiocordyceps camponoti-rufipedis]
MAAPFPAFIRITSSFWLTGSRLSPSPANPPPFHHPFTTLSPPFHHPFTTLSPTSEKQPAEKQSIPAIPDLPPLDSPPQANLSQSKSPRRFFQSFLEKHGATVSPNQPVGQPGKSYRATPCLAYHRTRFHPRRIAGGEKANPNRSSPFPHTHTHTHTHTHLVVKAKTSQPSGFQPPTPPPPLPPDPSENPSSHLFSTYRIITPSTNAQNKPLPPSLDLLLVTAIGHCSQCLKSPPPSPVSPNDKKRTRKSLSPP